MNSDLDLAKTYKLNSLDKGGIYKFNLVENYIKNGEWEKAHQILQLLHQSSLDHELKIATFYRHKLNMPERAKFHYNNALMYSGHTLDPYDVGEYFGSDYKAEIRQFLIKAMGLTYKVSSRGIETPYKYNDRLLDYCINELEDKKLAAALFKKLRNKHKIARYSLIIFNDAKPLEKLLANSSPIYREYYQLLVYFQKYVKDKSRLKEMLKRAELHLYDRVGSFGCWKQLIYLYSNAGDLPSAQRCLNRAESLIWYTPMHISLAALARNIGILKANKTLLHNAGLALGHKSDSPQSETMILKDIDAIKNHPHIHRSSQIFLNMKEKGLAKINRIYGSGIGKRGETAPLKRTVEETETSKLGEAQREAESLLMKGYSDKASAILKKQFATDIKGANLLESLYLYLHITKDRQFCARLITKFLEKIANDDVIDYAFFALYRLKNSELSKNILTAKFAAKNRYNERGLDLLNTSYHKIVSFYAIHLKDNEACRKFIQELKTGSFEKWEIYLARFVFYTMKDKKILSWIYQNIKSYSSEYIYILPLRRLL